MMTYYAVIDTNVLVSSLLSNHDNAATVQVANRLYDGDFIINTGTIELNKIK